MHFTLPQKKQNNDFYFESTSSPSLQIHSFGHWFASFRWNAATQWPWPPTLVFNKLGAIRDDLFVFQSTWRLLKLSANVYLPIICPPVYSNMPTCVVLKIIWAALYSIYFLNTWGLYRKCQMERKERIKAIWVAEQHVPTRTDCRFCDIDESNKKAPVLLSWIRSHVPYRLIAHHLS